MGPKAFSSTLSIGTAIFLLVNADCSSANGASPTINQALIIGPIKGSPDGVALQKLIDTNGDIKVNKWYFFYLDGVEFSRPIDPKLFGKANQFRWLNAIGSHWRLNGNGNGRIDSWRILSPEEATSEIVAALANRVSDRFASALLTRDNLET